MTLRRIATAAAQIAVAILLALCVPTSQLRLEVEGPACCCPDPTKCKCHDHGKDPASQSTMRACHKQTPEIVQAQLAAFVAPERIVIDVPVRPFIAVLPALDDPHAPPTPQRPDAPS